MAYPTDKRHGPLTQTQSVPVYSNEMRDGSTHRRTKSTRYRRYYDLSYRFFVESEADALLTHHKDNIGASFALNLYIDGNVSAHTVYYDGDMVKTPSATYKQWDVTFTVYEVLTV